MRAIGYLAVLSAAASPVLADAPWVRDYDAYNVQKKFGLYPNQTYKSTPINSPLLHVSTFDKNLLDDEKPYIFLTMDNTTDNFALIYRADDLSLVYKSPGYHPDSCSNARVQPYMGQQMFTYWCGIFSGGHGSGSVRIMDSHYDMKMNVTALGEHYGVDMHESQMTPDGTLLITSYVDKQMDLTSVGGPKNGTLADGCFQEIDLYTNERLFYWCASDHFNLTMSYAPYSNATTGSVKTGGGYGVSVGWDWFHLNSIQKRNGNYLINGRLLKMVSYVSGLTGEPIFILGGKANQFKDLSNGQATNFAWEHHVRFRNPEMTQLTMFDNQETSMNQNCTTNCSRGLQLDLDIEKKTVSLAQAYLSPDHLTTGAMGSMQPLSNRNVLIGWGVNPSFSEFLPNGTCVMNVQMSAYGRQFFNYRAFREHWIGRPKWPPAVAVEDDTIYMSWNGATELASWKIMTGPSPSNLTTSSLLVARNGFETSARFDASIGYVAVEAWDRNGTVIGRTGTIDLKTGYLIANGTSSYDTGNRMSR